MFGFVLTSILWAASYLLITRGMSTVPKEAMWLARLAGVLALVPLALFARQWRRVRVSDAAVVGGLGLGAFFFLEIFYRAQWGPSGADALFMLSTVPLWVALAALVRRQRGAGLALLAAVFVVLANVMILANWERPSSFAPFALFSRADVSLLLAAAVFGIGGLEAERRLPQVPALGRAAAAGLGAIWLIALVPFSGSISQVTGSVDWSLLVAIAVVGGAALVLVWHHSVRSVGALAASFACGLAPAVLSAYVFIERPFGTEHGPVPLIVGPVLAGAVLSLLAAWAGISAARVGDTRARASSGPLLNGENRRPALTTSIKTSLLESPLLSAPAGRIALGLAFAAGVAALGGMWMPSLSSHLESHLGPSGYSVTWLTGGISTVGPWLALAAAAAALLAPIRGRDGWIWAALIASAGAASAVAGWSLFSAWHGWIPVNVQQALGSSYAFLAEYPKLNPGVLIAPWLALAALVIRLVLAPREAGREAEAKPRKSFLEAAKRAVMLTVVALLVLVSGCVPVVTVKTGTQVVCRYGHVVSQDIRTIKVPADQASRYQVKTVYEICPRHREAEALMAKAAADLARGQRADAKTLVARAYALAGDVKDAAGLGDKLGVKKPPGAPSSSGAGNGGTGGNGAGGGGGTSAPTGGGIVSPTDLMSSIPRSLAGYAFVSENRSEVAATRTFRALSGNPSQLIIQISYLGRPAAYQLWFDQRIKYHYDESASTSTVGRRSVYFGTDGRLFATAAWRSGASAIQVEAASKGKPAALKGAIMTVVGRLP